MTSAARVLTRPILARSLGIPAVVGLKDATKYVEDGMELILDGYRGVVVINPNESTTKKYTKRKNWCDELDSELLKEANEPALTTDGRLVQVEANIELLEELPSRNPMEQMASYYSEPNK